MTNFLTNISISFRPYVQVQAEARKADVMKNSSKTKAAKQGFSYLDASQQTPAQTSTTPWGSKLDQNVPGAQMNAEDFTKQFMSSMYGGQQPQQQQSTMMQQQEMNRTTQHSTFQQKPSSNQVN